MKYHLIKLLLFSALLFFPTYNSYSQITVDNLLDGPASGGDCEIDAPPVGGNCSLRDAIEAANSNAGPDQIEFLNTLTFPGTISLTDGFMTITDDLTITGPGASMLEIDAQDNSRIFLVDNGSDADVIVVEIIGLEFTNGFAQGSGFDDDGGVIFNNENLTIESCVFEDNQAEGNGGAIYNNNTNTLLNIRNSDFLNNTASIDCNACDGGAIYNSGDDPPDLPAGTINEIVNSNFIGNSLMVSFNPLRGGAIANFGLIRKIVGCLFENNTIIDEGSTGGAILNNEIIEEIINTRFEDNIAESGGAIHNIGSIVLIDNSIFDGNSTLLDNRFTGGGAIRVLSGGIISEIRNSTFNDNTSVSGGAISLSGTSGDNAEITTINNSTFSNNTADASVLAGGPTNLESGTGGAISFISFTNTANIINSTFSGNLATPGSSSTRGQGGAIHVIFSSASPVNISFSTFAGNTAIDGLGAADGGALAGVSTAYNIRNSIFSNNVVSAGVENCESNYIDLASEINNFADDASCGFGAGDNATINLGNLMDNGGPTETHALNAGSDPLEAAVPCDSLNEFGGASGVALTTDQRLFTRPSGTDCDSGAFESGAAPETVEIILTKITVPEDNVSMFDFESTGFPNSGCDIEPDFQMSHNDTITCDIPVGMYSIDEDVPSDRQLQIVCNEAPNNLVVDNMTGETTFEIISPTDNVNCVYINASPNSLVLVTDEPAGANCQFGGVRVDTGFDDNFDTMLDPGEIDDTQFFCNTQQVVPFPIPTPVPDGDDESDVNITPGNGNVLASIEIDSSLGGGGQILVDLPEGTLPLLAELSPDVGTCEILETSSTARVVDLDVSCEINNFPEDLDLLIDLCNQNGNSGIGNAEVVVVANNAPDEDFDSIIELALNSLEECDQPVDQNTNDSDDDSDDNDSLGEVLGCSLASNDANKSSVASNLFITLFPLFLGFGGLVLRRNKIINT